MKLSLRWWPVLLALLPGMLWLGHVYRARSFKVYAASPSRQFQVYGLRFQGVNPHPLDGCLRVYVYGDTETFDTGVWQTTIPWDMDLKAEWRGDEQGSFAILKDGREMMAWEIHSDGAVCTKGGDLITYDPHDLWMRTGRSRP